MINKIKHMLTHGIKFPYAWDAVTQKPSVTLFFPYVAFWLFVISWGFLHFHSHLTATLVMFGAWVIAMVFYLIRQINKAKIDLDDQSLELENDQKD